TTCAGLAGRGRGGADRWGPLRRNAAVYLRSLVVLDQLAGVVRDSYRHSDAGSRIHLCGRAGVRARRNRAAPARAVRALLAFRLLDPRRARVRLSHLAAAPASAGVGHVPRLRALLRVDVPCGGPAGSDCRTMARTVRDQADGRGGFMNRRDFARLLAVGGAAPFLTPDLTWPRP